MADTSPDALSFPDPDQELAAPDDGRWHAKDTRDLAFLVEVIGDAEKDLAELDDQVADATLRFKARLDAHRKELLKGKAKSKDLATGRIGWRGKAGRLVVVNKELLLAWLQEQPLTSGLYRMKMEPDLVALQELQKSTGEVPPGMDYEPESETFYVKPALVEVAAPAAAPALTPAHQEQP